MPSAWERKAWRSVLVLMVASTVTACLNNASCADLRGVYPPESVTVVAVDAVDAPFTSWGCQGYDSGPLVDEIPDLAVEPAQEIRVEVPLRSGAELEVRVLTQNGEHPLDVITDGHSHAVAPLPEGSTALFIRLCTSDGRCANYEVNLSHTGN